MTESSPAQQLADPQSWLAALRAAYADSLQAGARFWEQAQRAVDEGQAAADDLAAAALAALEAMAEDDPTSLGMSACEALRRCGGQAQLEALRALRPKLPPRKGLRDWRVDADHAIAVIAARVAGDCTCAAEAERGAAYYGEQWQVEEERSDPASYCTRASVRCKSCGARWSVRRDDGYHYPVFSWSGA